MVPREVKLPSGAVLKIQPAPFAQAKALYQASLLELKGISLDGNVGNLVKNLMCAGFGSPAVEAALGECLKRCTVAAAPGAPDLKIDETTFEPVERREDYLEVLSEVALENLAPFMKSLYAGYRRITERMPTDIPA